MGKQCPNCGTSEFEEDNGSRVCTGCGNVVEEVCNFHHDFQSTGVLVEDAQLQNYRPNGLEQSTLPASYLRDLRSVVRTSQIAEGRKHAVKVIRRLVSFICGHNSKQIIESCIEKQNKLYDEFTEFRCALTATKEMVAGSCVYIVCREEDFPVTVDFISGLLGVLRVKFASVLVRVQDRLGVKAKGLDLESCVNNVCKDGCMGNDVCLLVKQMLPLFKDSWINEGRQVTSCIRPACYFAWQSLDFGKRKKVGLAEFIKSQTWDPKTIRHQERSRFKEIEMMLTKMCSVIPWINLRKGNLSLHLKDILDYQKTICYELKIEHACDTVPSLIATHQRTEVDSNPKDSPSKSRTSSLQTEEAPTSNKRPASAIKNYDPKQLKISVDGFNIEGNKSVFLPSAFVRRFAVPDQVTHCELSTAQKACLDAEELSERDVSSEEMKNYIRTPQEILQAKQLAALNKLNGTDKL